MIQYLIYRAEDGVLRPHSEKVYLALTKDASGILIDRSDQALKGALTKAMHTAWDELLLVTDDLLGPMDAERLQVMMKEMSAREVDCWSIAPLEQYGDPHSPEIPWLAIRRKALESPAFRALLESQPERLMQALLTSLQQAGCSCDSLLPADMPADPQADSLMLQPYTAAVEQGCPFIDLRSFTVSHALLLRYTMGEEPGRLLRWLQENDHDTDALWDWLLAGRFDQNVVENLGLMACLDTSPVMDAEPCPPGKCCLLMHLYFTELGAEALHYARSMPPEADIYITTSSEEKKTFYESLFAALPNRVEVRATVNRGRDMASLLVSLRDVTKRYELCCFYHDKKSSFCSVASVGRSFAYLISESALATPGYVQRMLRLFDGNPRLGVLCAMTPHHGDYYAVNARFWDHNLEQARMLLDRLGITLEVAEDRPLPAAWGSVFWFRVRALAPLLDYPWTYEDFPPEPYPVDGSVAHAIERIHCLVAQSQGYYTSMVAPAHLAALGMINFRQYTRDYVMELDSAHMLAPHREALRQMHKVIHGPAVRLKLWLVKKLKRMLGEERYLRLKGMLHVNG